MANYKIHFGKNISYKSNFIEFLSSENFSNNLIYIKDNQLTLLPPGSNNQYLSYNNGEYSWKTISKPDPGDEPLEPEINEYLTFTANSENSVIGVKELIVDTIMYRTNINSDFVSWDGSEITLTKIGDYVQFWNTTNTLSNYEKQFTFTMIGSVAASGNVNSMLNFSELHEYCYNAMFLGCTGLTTAPELPATTLAPYCYQYMFSECVCLTTAPELPATSLASGCYQYMFNDCTSLVTASELLATDLSEACYFGMFNNCINLQFGPELPATTLAQYCYYYMFRGCTKLKSLKVHFMHWNWRSILFGIVAYLCCISWYI